MTQDKSLDPKVLRQFTDSEHWYRHGLVRSILFTDGAKYIADQAGAYWLLDEIAFAQRGEQTVAAEFQVWRVKVNAGPTAGASWGARRRRPRCSAASSARALPAPA